MESASVPSPSDAAEQLAAAGDARRASLARLELPPGHSLLTGLGSSTAAYGVALGNSSWRFGPAALALAVALGGALIGVAVRRFRRHNGAWVSGLRGPRSTWPVLAAFSCGAVLVFVGASTLMADGRPLLSGAVALAALPLTAVGDRWWMARCHDAP